MSDSVMIHPETTALNEFEDRAQQFAKQQSVGGSEKLSLLPILEAPRQTETALRKAYQHFSKLAEEDLAISYGGEWLLDNFYVVQQALREISEDMPPAFYRQLPRLSSSPLQGYPRIYAVAHELIQNTNRNLDLEQIKAFIAAYQYITPLTMGELWALPTMLRIGSLENLSQAVIQLIGLDVDHVVGPALIDLGVVVDESRIANCILNLRLLANQDWKDFFEAVSRVEQILRRDPVYAEMNFETRNYYRETIEQLSPKIGQAEELIAQAAVDLASRVALQLPHPDRTAHVGYYLLDKGRAELDALINYHPSAKIRLRRWATANNAALYIGSIILFTLIVVAAIATYTLSIGGNWLQIFGISVVSSLPASAVTVGLINWAISYFTTPHRLSKMDFLAGIPDLYKTAVVIPALLTSPEEIQSLTAQLELHFLSNQDANLRFVLLGDFADAQQQHMPDDEALITVATARIEALNAQYSQAGGFFYLFLRERRWNAGEQVWMAWERKRGKLIELNRLVMGNKDSSFMLKVGDLDQFSGMRYVITLDADTVLPRDSAAKLVATMAHPLNRAQFDAHDRVIAGYTILQPRVQILPSANRSQFARIFAGNTGLDLYTLAASDVYQDLFGEGIYVGKGIYDVAAFERSLANRIPENALLSHDLFEGLWSRAALVTDIVLLEKFPSHYLAHTERMRRWIRGDWQLLPWLLPRVPGTDGLIANQFSMLDRWKILDNLRRSLVTPTLLLFFIMAWVTPPGSPLVWTILGLVLTVIPFVMGSLTQIVQTLQNGTPFRGGYQIRLDVVRWLLALVFVPYEAGLSIDAIVTTLIRLRTRRYMLQWTTAAASARLLGNLLSLDAIWQKMIASLALTLGIALLVTVTHPSAFFVAVPLLVAWFAAPRAAHWLSQPIKVESETLTGDQEAQLRELARQTWLYFEKFVGPADHWLPPDHFQQSPRGIVAHQTSPTNIGLLLLSTLAAYDFGYIGLLDLILRLRSTFETLQGLERYRGHFLNWYDTQSLKPLLPRYVSTVDSGNLIGSLFTLRQALQDILRTPIMRGRRWQGILDTLNILNTKLMSLTDPGIDVLHDDLARIIDKITAVQSFSLAWTSNLIQLAETQWPQFSQRLLVFCETAGAHLDPMVLEEVRIYSDRAFQTIVNLKRDIDILLPWLFLFENSPTLFSRSDLDPAIGELWLGLKTLVATIPSLGEISNVYRAGQTQAALLRSSLVQSHQPRNNELNEAVEWCGVLITTFVQARMDSEALQIGFQDLNEQAELYIKTTDFRFLFNLQRRVFHIGYNVITERLDNSFYDLLASEARLASLIAIAKDDIPQSHWLHLSRPLTEVDGKQALLSWSGTMFEYLMPRLLMRTYPNTLLDQSYQSVVDYQIAYGQQNKVPWGISESGFYAFDGNANYQYRAFGVPRLAFKRGMADDLVIAPYASLIALPIRPLAVLKNLAQLREQQAIGVYGLFEAIDYTPNRMGLGRTHAVIQEYMAHHQGMILLALDNYFHDDVMVKRFHADPRIQSIELLLQELIPPNPELQNPTPENGSALQLAQAVTSVAPWTAATESPLPQVHYLSNGNYGVLLTSSGGGYSQWKSTDLTRWHADTTLDEWGTWIYIKDEEDGAVWSAGYQPTAVSPNEQQVLFHPYKAEFQRRDHDISLNLEVSVAPSDDVEMRRIRLTNHSNRKRRLTVTSYGEVILTAQANDLRHPAFNKLFIESEVIPELETLLFHRRPRSATETPIFLAHLLIGKDGPLPIEYETDRAQFIGRYQTPRTPLALMEKHLSGTIGATLDPIFALGCTVELEPYGSVQFAYLTIAAETRPKILEIAGRYRNWSVLDHAFEQARYQSELELRQLALDTPDLELIQQMLGALFYPYLGVRAPAATLAANTKAQPGLWAFGISGDYPIVLVHISNDNHLGLVRDLLRAHIYWRNRQIKVTLVILNEHDSAYTQELYSQVYRLVSRNGGETWLNRHDGIFILPADRMNDADRILLDSATRVNLDGEKGSLRDQLAALRQMPIYLPAFIPVAVASNPAETTDPLLRPTDLLFDNGSGGFSPDGREYVIYLEAGRTLPAPWINVIATPQFGFIASEAGLGCTWAGNSGENRITAWHNDPVSDRPSEALYLRDEETARIWSPTLLPTRDEMPYLIRHGAGYSIFEHRSDGLAQTLRVFAVPDAPLKVIQLRLENTWHRPRRITLTYYADWILGTTKDVTQQYIIPEFDANSHTLLARNPYSPEFGTAVAFVTASKDLHGLTTDRAEFLGRLGSSRNPVALSRIGLGGTVSAGLDTCAVLQLHIDLPIGGSEEVFFILGQAESRDRAIQLATDFQQPAKVDSAWQAVHDFWEKTLNTVTIRTPNAALNLLPRWLLYQTLSCRIWGRAALYQSSGAFGFRDQLQDILAVIHAQPGVAREHILEAARHQFDAGDVLHWWHPPSGRGVRTRFSDDLLWLPFVVSEYVSVTGDQAILDEHMPFLKGEPLKPGEDERYGLYEATSEKYSLYEHCRRALEKGSTHGTHGLPLMGSGDWNDGMNRVGIEGRGESVWVGWFLYATLGRFIPLSEARGETKQAVAYRRQADELQSALENQAWDGEWYLRAFYDDGLPLGAAQNQECRIDSIAQSWAVLSGAGENRRIYQAMESVAAQLIDTEAQALLLFTPPFDKTPRDPGYIKGYPPGIRENGGQYTHAALWTIWAFAALGQGDRAEALIDMLNPILHSDTAEKMQRYRVEPYVIAADVYSMPPYQGRGGWTWYTGSSGWMYRLIVEALLGLKRTGSTLHINPCIPKAWAEFDLTLQERGILYDIHVENPEHVNRGVCEVIVDGQIQPSLAILLTNGSEHHTITIRLGIAFESEEKFVGVQ
ncbi:MAG: glucoamylase family protein [Chloroflexota bacterium]